MALQRLVTGAAPTYKNVPRLDITNLYPVAQWVTNGQAFWGRADGYDDTPASGLLDLNDRIAASTKLLSQPAGQTPIVPKADVGYLGDRRTLEFGQGAGTAVPSQHLDSAAGYLPTTGPFAIYMPVHPYSSVVDLIGGQDNRLGLFVTLVNGDLRFYVSSGGSSCTLSTGLGSALKNVNMLVGVIRRADGYLVARMRRQGQAWQQQVSGAANAAAIASAFRVGKVRSTSDASSNAFYGRMGEIIVHSGAMSAEQQASYEAYLSHYYAIA